MSQSATLAVIAIMLALIVKAALEAAFNPIFDGKIIFGDVPLLAWGQLFVFFILTLRFYLGAIRYVEIEPKNIGLFIRSVNLIFAFGLFCNFYVIALSVTHPQYFYYLVVLLHLVDAAWFIVAFALSSFAALPDQKGEIKKASTRKVMTIFLSFDVLTLTLVVIWYLFVFPQDLTSDTQTTADWAFLGTLFVTSLLDFYVLEDYYFKTAEWRAKHEAA
jgi:hypothetical protein